MAHHICVLLQKVRSQELDIACYCYGLSVAGVCDVLDKPKQGDVKAAVSLV